MQPNQIMTAKDVARHLGVATSTVYTLPIPHYAYGSKRVYEIEDVEAYKQSCRLLKTKKVGNSALNLIVSSPQGGTALQNYFQKAGRSAKRMSTTKEKPRASTHLQLVK